MVTKFIGIKEFRQNISSYADKARESDSRFVVMNRTRPLFEITPFGKDSELDDVVARLAQAERDVKAGRTYTHEEVIAHLGLE